MSTITSINETIYAVWNTTAGGDNSPSTVGNGSGNYYPGEEPPMAFDLNITTKFTAFGICYVGVTFNDVCGVNTGFYITPIRGSSLLRSFRFCTANSYPPRDPMTVTLEGSNQPTSTLTEGTR